MPSDRPTNTTTTLLQRFARVLRPLAARLRVHPRLGRLALALIPNVTLKIDLPDIGPFSIRMRQHRSYWLRGPQGTERVPFAMLRAMVRPGDLVYDVGANIGLYTRMCAALGAGEVIAFEPVAANRELHGRNAALGGLRQRVRCLDVALSDRDEEADFQLDDMQSTSGTLDRVTGGAASEGRRNLDLAPRTAKVLCRKLDSLVSGGELPPPDLMKLDVEGAEAMVLRGGRNVLATHPVRIVLELHGADVAREAAGLLLDLGYACRAAVIRELDPSGFAPVTRELLSRLQGPYDLQYLVASKNPTDLPETV